jgi:hypothetical protein
MGDLVVNPTIRWTRSAGIEQSPDHKTEPSPTGRAQHNIRTKDDARTAADGQIREANADGLRVGEAVKQPNPITNASTQEQSPRHRDIQTPRTGAFGPSSTASAGRPQPIGGTQRLATGAVRAVTTFAKAVLSFFESIASLFEQVLGGGHSRLDREETAERREEPEPEFAPDLQADNVRAEEAAHTQRSQELMRRHGVAILPEQAHHLDVERGRER